MSCRILGKTKAFDGVEKFITYAVGLYIGLTFQVAAGFIAGMLLYSIHRVVIGRKVPQKDA